MGFQRIRHDLVIEYTHRHRHTDTDTQTHTHRHTHRQTDTQTHTDTHTHTVTDWFPNFHHKYNPCLNNFRLIKLSTDLGFWGSLLESSVLPLSLSSCDSETSLIFTQNINYLCFFPVLPLLILGSCVLSTLDLISFYWHIPPVAS